jgi:1,4-dihydroxy-6-naphthoate synthase
MKTLKLGYSPCPNDTFIFYAMIHGKIETGNLNFNEILLDVEDLNRKALNTELDLSKVSYNVYGRVSREYLFLRSGGALGRGCGPLLIAKERYSIDELKGKKIAVPGIHTTAYLLLQLLNPSLVRQSSIHPMPFNEIIKSVTNGAVDAGLIIHESRFTYASHGLRKIVDLGEWWESETGLPIPLGGIIARRSLGNALTKNINTIIRSSIKYASSNRSEPMAYIQQHSQELSPDIINQHINLYVNEYSFDIGDDGEKAAIELLMRAADAGIIQKVEGSIFI